ncbi:hypothetical protein HU200_020629 [Digitaria exilis]|uniref:Glycosyltransferase n=1 Tax=Digitaria exilis TaxID=1010633 RepID=A0A835F283_9POAL|nr:hypothetical protein HU200_020629 [Digitaria exilis]
MEQQEPSAMATKHHPQQQQHFLIVTYPAQGHITPARHLARRLATTCPGARATICVPLSAFRRMFPCAAATATAAEEEMAAAVSVDSEQVAYVAYSDGYDGGFDSAADSYASYMERARSSGERSLAAALRRLRAAGRPVTCAVYTLLLPWVAAVARDHGVPATAVFWIQPATALAAYFHYFRGHRDAFVAAAAKSGEDAGVQVRLPGLQPLRVRDLPSFLAITDDDHPFAFVLPEFRELIDAVERDGGSSSRTYVLANTFDAMEHDALESLSPHIEVFAVGPVLSFLHEEADDIKNTPSPPRDVFEHDKSRYLSWLDSKPSKSVVYISFGSSSVMSRNQVTEITNAMARIKRPFLWVLRKDNCKDDNKDDAAAIKKLASSAADDDNAGMVVAWCDQARVLSHASVACFVTHGGWNSTLESVACGVPLVVAPQYSDQGTAAWLVAERVGAGVRAAAREADGVVDADELVRCVEVATSEAVAARAAAWKEEARAAVADGGGSDRSLREFLRQIAGDGN